MEVTINWWTTTFIIATSVIIWWAARWAINRVTTRFDTLIEEVQKLGKSLVYQQGRVRTIEEAQKRAEKRLNSHANRIRSLELGTVMKIEHEPP